jgi:hypothetical protein
MQPSDILSIISVSAVSLAALIPPVVDYFKWRCERKQNFVFQHRAEVLESFLSTSAKHLLSNGLSGDYDDLYAAYGSVAPYVSSDTAAQMLDFCNHLCSPLPEGENESDAIKRRIEMFNAVVKAVKSERPRR